MHSFAIGASLSLLLLSSACTFRKNESRLSENLDRPLDIPVLIAMAQGFYSCRTEREHIFLKTRDIIDATRDELAARLPGQARLRVSYMDICFDGGILENLAAEKIYHTLTREDGQTYPRRQAGPSTIHAIIEDVAENMGTSENPTKVFLIGHSHGGWLSINTAIGWRNKAELRRLFTIDPISYAKCTQGYIIYNRLLKGLSVLQLIPDQQCTRFPSDQEPMAPAARKKITGGWTNFFQNEFRWLHSSRVTAADYNLLYDFGDLSGFDFEHGAILSDKRVWQTINLQIKGDLLEAAQTLP